MDLQPVLTAAVASVSLSRFASTASSVEQGLQVIFAQYTERGIANAEEIYNATSKKQ